MSYKWMGSLLEIEEKGGASGMDCAKAYVWSLRKEGAGGNCNPLSFAYS